jgi:ascorbate-specific PTS system EIIC-type component UlaA
MPSTAIALGILLILIGIIGYAYGSTSGNASITALIPAFFGIVLAALGAAARAKDNLRKHLMHAALVVALLGFIMPTGRLLSRADEFVLSPATLAQILMAAVCLVFLTLGIKSFADARRNRVV